ncbi:MULTISPECIES: sulfate adenylyltransferase subunit 1 [Cellulophaga]|uniref:sulfate adenylyltransferase n=2 Tax=Cellulophaga TaxID=104264 RepID=F0RD92_CELLC|nr:MULTISPECIES: GTP-binding protein [Cellulophaga]ADY29793.1 sulfate adenylyltransferase, large subunit [Cellulophaga lytica DSM 7489]AIM60792.1 sulfate adenylyltransferase [Cellulophaga lytica]APU10665.1 sulfate adenylyltransferase [Cellulophaga lytica]EWH15159.1 sulfate adenylyltransferase [Cellulophaga geojensis KL-A]MDO6490381.1 GTP-binding protein [Cellulophaga sp. 2_MG-2023]
MNVLKIATAGSVDDGKSTLIGRLLYDTKSLTEDKLEAIKKSSEQRGYDYLDFSLATDGLVAEREQGITIDVAHIYFSTPTKSYIIADTPGHVEYTRNMVTGASTSQVAIILIDARKGVIEQTYRHFFINNLLRVKNVIVAVNKMDLVDYSEEVFNNIKKDFEALNAKSTYAEQIVSYIPVSALKGDNIVDKTDAMSWYNGDTILGHLEELEAQDLYDAGKVRFPVQTVIRPKTDEFHDFRGYAGKISGGSLKVGDAVTVLPSLTQSKIKEIFFFDKTYAEAPAGSSVNITLEDDINITRGDMLVKTDELPKIEKQVTATVCWMDSKNLVPGTKYIVQHNTNRVLSKIDSINSVIATDYTGEQENNNKLSLNEIGEVSIKLSKPIYFDSYNDNKSNGAFILIDAQTNTTAGAGFIS